MKRPIVGAVPQAARSPKLENVAEVRRWTFSLRYFRQTEYFGLGKQDGPWFVAVLERLGELSKKTIEDILSNPAEKLAWRQHEINWNAKNIPVARSDLNWIDRVYLENDAEYPLMQFQVSKALGRVIGFFDENQIFNIVLLDPFHNMQPSDYSDYKLRATRLAEPEYVVTVRTIEEKIASCTSEGCGCRGLYATVQAELTRTLPFHAMVVHMTEDVYERASASVEGKITKTMGELVELGLDSLGL